MNEAQIPEAWRDWWSERSAIGQYDGGLSRVVAENLALKLLKAHIAGVTPDVTLPETRREPPVTGRELFC